MAQYFPHPRRIVTGHDAEGNAVVLKDSQITCFPVGPSANFAELWKTSTELPVSNEGDEDPIKDDSAVLSTDDGVLLRVVDVPANTVTLGK